MTLDREKLKIAGLKALIVLVPSYAAAFVTDKMVYVVPTLAAAGFFAANVDQALGVTIRRVDDGDFENEAEDVDIDQSDHGDTHDHSTDSYENSSD